MEVTIVMNSLTIDRDIKPRKNKNPQRWNVQLAIAKYHTQQTEK
jgi:hypothetical protein